MPGFDDIPLRLQAVSDNIARIARESGRNSAEINLIAVSKTHPLEAVAAAANAGQCHFGENTVQDALTKIPHLTGRNLTWHFIGHLQSNKAKFLPGNFQWLHSLDSESIASRVSRLAQEQKVVIETLIEVNVALDPRRHGVTPDSLSELIESLLMQDLPGIRLRGLMAIAPHPASETEVRNAFATVRALRDEIRAVFRLPSFDQLSMGMSGDYAEAIKEGSTMVRIGSAIFGERDYT